METVRTIYHHEAAGWRVESPDVEGWSAAGDTSRELGQLAAYGIPFVLDQSAEMGHYVPAGERVAA